MSGESVRPDGSGKSGSEVSTVLIGGQMTPHGSEPAQPAPPLGSTPTPVAPLLPSTQWYEAKLKEIAIARANIDTQRVYCQTARINGVNNAHYYNEVVKFHQTTNALAEIARELASRIAQEVMK